MPFTPDKMNIVDTMIVWDVPPPDVPVVRDVPVTPDVPPPTCTFAGAESVVISYTGPNSVAMDCSAPRGMPGGTPLVVTRTAAVVDVVDDAMGATVRLDFCSPAADCVPMIGTLRVTAPRFNLGATPVGLRRGQYVQVRSRATWSWGCTMQVELKRADVGPRAEPRSARPRAPRGGGEPERGRRCLARPSSSRVGASAV